MSAYQSISCIEHERLEFAVLRRQRLRLHLADGRDVAALPVDVVTRDGAEWLSYRVGEGAVEVVRLDRILGFTPV